MSEEKKEGVSLETNNVKYLGPKKVRSVKPNPENDKELFVEFKNGDKVVMRQKLYDLMVSDTKTESATDDLTGAINYFIAKKIVLDLADYGLERYQVTSVATAVGTLMHNLTEAKIGEKFNCANSDRILIEDVLK